MRRGDARCADITQGTRLDVCLAAQATAQYAFATGREPVHDVCHQQWKRGQVRQVSYPGGFWRYAVAVGEQEFMVDDERRREPGAAVGIRLASSAVHLFPDRR